MSLVKIADLWPVEGERGRLEGDADGSNGRVRWIVAPNINGDGNEKTPSYALAALYVYTLEPERPSHPNARPKPKVATPPNAVTVTGLYVKRDGQGGPMTNMSGPMYPGTNRFGYLVMPNRFKRSDADAPYCLFEKNPFIKEALPNNQNPQSPTAPPPGFNDDPFTLP